MPKETWSQILFNIWRSITERLGSMASRKFLFMVGSLAIVWFWIPELVKQNVLSVEEYSHTIDMWWVAFYSYLGFNLLQKTSWFNNRK